MESATLFTIFSDFSAVACCRLPYQHGRNWTHLHQ